MFNRWDVVFFPLSLHEGHRCANDDTNSVAAKFVIGMSQRSMFRGIEYHKFVEEINFQNKYKYLL